MKNVVVIIGSAGLLGRAFTEYLLRAGYSVVLADVNEETLQAHSTELEREGFTDYHPVLVDATDRASLEKLLESSVNRFGSVDALVNNIYPRNKDYGKGFFDVTYDSFVENTGMNLGGYFLASQVFSRYFIENKKGSIVNVASIYGSVAPKFEIYEGTPMTMPVEYSVIKSGVIHLSKYMARYFAGSNVRVNSLSPGGILDAQPEAFLGKYRSKTLNKGMLDAKDLCGALEFLISSKSEYVNGQDLVVDDGFTL